MASALSPAARRALRVGAAVYVAAAGAAFVVFRPSQPPPSAVATRVGADGRPLPPTEAERRAAFDANAARYDEEVETHEWLSGISGLRGKLVRGLGARKGGSEGGPLVLEVGVGTGRQLDHYPPGARVVGADFSPAMLDVARRRAQRLGWEVAASAEELMRGSKAAASEAAPAAARADAPGSVVAALSRVLPDAVSSNAPRRLALVRVGAEAPSGGIGEPAAAAAAAAEAESLAAAVALASPSSAAALPASVPGSHALPFPSGSFDAAVDTFGLCSYEDPVAMLREVARVVRPRGRIFLLEHGESEWGWLNGLLHRSAAGHAARHGCWWDRDIEGLVAQAGLRVVRRERRHAGTTYFLVVEEDGGEMKGGSGRGAAMMAGQQQR
jgi:methyltransferase OMS1